MACFACQRQQFNQALANFKRDARYQQLLSKYQLQSRQVQQATVNHQ
ncbi:hypothetical protein [Arsukibacterium ikkense]|nr:hypothetical protein [Arsukibacterium ikkense]